MKLKNLNILEGKKALIIGIANENSIAYGCAKSFKESGADIAITYLNSKTKEFVDPINQELQPSIYMQCDVEQEEQVSDLFQEINNKWGKVDIVLHSIAFAPKEDLHGRIVDCSKEGFLKAMEISCYSFLNIAKYAEPLMKDGGSLFTMSYYGSSKVIKNYNLMGPVKSALESCVRYMAYELGEKGIRVHALSPGPLKTRAASGIDHFDELLADARAKAPMHQLVTIEEVGATATFLATDYAKHLTGETIYVDAGYHIVG